MKHSNVFHSYNVLHLVCEYGHVTLFETIFRRVSPAVLNSLVSRQSYRRQNTVSMLLSLRRVSR